MNTRRLLPLLAFALLMSARAHAPLLDCYIEKRGEM